MENMGTFEVDVDKEAWIDPFHDHNYSSDPDNVHLTTTSKLPVSRQVNH